MQEKKTRNLDTLATHDVHEMDALSESFFQINRHICYRNVRQQLCDDKTRAIVPRRTLQDNLVLENNNYILGHVYCRIKLNLLVY